MARAREIPGFDCDETFRRAAARVVEIRASEAFEYTERVLDLDDVERVHDLRVATRRLRAALEVFEPCFPPGHRRKALKKVKALADALGARRDRDVQIEFVEGLAAEIPVGDQADVTALLERLRQGQSQANRELARFVAEKRLRKLQRHLRRLVEAAEA